MKINNAIIGVGSNINPEQHVIQAENEIKRLGFLKQKSDFLYTKPLLYQDQDDFLNGIFHLETLFGKLELNKMLKEIELKLGRIRDENKNGPRTIDLDIVVFNNQIVDRDVFQRDFLKNPILALFPFLLPVLHCKNYSNNFNDIYRVIEIIKSKLPNDLISIFGTGHWFCDEENTTQNIDLIVVVKDIDPKYERLVNQELETLQLNRINEFFVQVHLFCQEELDEKLAGKCKLENNKKKQPLFIKPQSSYKLLYGQPWPQ